MTLAPGLDKLSFDNRVNDHGGDLSTNIDTPTNYPLCCVIYLCTCFKDVNHLGIDHK